MDETGCPALQCTDADADGYNLEGGACGTLDCNDASAAAYPGAPEICDGEDNDCDTQIDEGCCPEITSFTGSNTTIDPTAGGSVSFSYDIDREYDNATITIDGKDIGGSSWNGLIDGKRATGGTHSAVLTVKKGDCTVTENIAVKVELDDSCKLKVTIGSLANVAGGELTDSLPLFSLPGSGPSFGVTLHYASLDNFSGTLGLGWSHNFESRLHVNAFGEAIVRLGDGTIKLYTPDGSGGFVAQPGDYSTLIKNADGSFTRTRKDGTREAYTASGELLSITDRNGNAVTLSYLNGRLATVSDGSGRSIAFAYDGNGHLSAITDPAGQTYSLTVGETLSSVVFPDGTTWRYSYAANAFLTGKLDPLGNLTTYAYDVRHRIVLSVDPEGRTRNIAYPTADESVRTTTFTEKDGGVWQYTYDTQSGDLLAKTDPAGNVTSYSYDANHNLTGKTDPFGTTTFAYDAAGNMTSITDVAGQTTSYTYNGFGQATSVTDAAGGVARYAYDANGNLTQTTDPSGATTTYGYDDKGDVVSVTDPAGRTTTMTYDTAGQLVSTAAPSGAASNFAYDVAGNLTNQTDGNGATTQFAYDERNRLSKVIDPAGSITTFAYDARGNKTSQTDAAGTTRYEYNTQGQHIKSTDPLGNATTYTYGSSGCPSCGGGTDKLTTVTDANGNTIRFEYDALGRKVKEIDPLGNAVSYSYDAKGNVLTRTDALGRVTSFAYDPLGRVLEQSDPLGGKVRFAYDATGRLTQVIDPIGVVTGYEYDAVGRLLRSDSPDAGATVYTYNPDGSLKAKTDANGTLVSYSYDAAGRLLEVRYPDDSENVTYSYDTCPNGKGRVCGMSDTTGTTAYGYDALGRIVAEQKTILGVTYTTSYEYDKVGQLKAVTYPSGRRIEYTYDQLKRPTNVTTKLSKPMLLAQNLVYDGVGNLLSSTFGNGLTQSWTYDAASRTRSIVVPGALGFRYTYDLAGNITAIDDAINPVASKTYGYDVLDRLSSAQGPWGSLAWSYDANGNRLTQQNGVKYTYSYEGNRLESVANGHIDYYRYDAAGNTLSDGKRDYVYNQNNRLIEALENGRTVGEYTYNGKGQRVVKQTGPAATPSASGQTTVYHYDLAGRLIEETAGNGKLLVDYIYLGSQPLVMLRKPGNGEETFYFHNDHLGTPKVLTDKLGKVVWNVEFDPFGNEVQTKGRQGSYIRNVENNLRFSGQYFDAETGLHQNGFRDYNPKKGRYFEFDPSGLRRDNLNPFVYGKNNLLSYVDPNGLRELYISEISALQKYFGSSIDASSIDLVQSTFGQMWSPYGNTISLPINYFKNNDNCSELDLNNISIYAVFVHEALHVWQRQHDISVTTRATLLQGLRFLTANYYDPYSYNQSLTDGEDMLLEFISSNVEAQGNIYQNFVLDNEYGLNDRFKYNLIFEYVKNGGSL